MQVIGAPVYRRVLLKMSGEALAGETHFGLNSDIVREICRQIKIVHDMGVEICIVVGGGNFWRGRSGEDMDRTRADHMGMVATVINALALQDALEHQDVPTRVQTAIEMKEIAEPYIRNRAVRHLEKGRVVIFGCGTGNPYFTTDTAAALRAAEINADIILLAKNVDGVYTADPHVELDAKKLDEISYLEIISRGLGVMDTTATSLCMDNDIPILVFGLREKDSIIKAMSGSPMGTMITNSGRKTIL